MSIIQIDQDKQNEIFSNGIRSKRDKLLSDSDWIIIKYKELGKTVPKEWKTYRQALRDITSQDNFPRRVEWPLSPAEESDGGV